MYRIAFTQARIGSVIVVIVTGITVNVIGIVVSCCKSLTLFVDLPLF